MLSHTTTWGGHDTPQHATARQSTPKHTTALRGSKEWRRDGVQHNTREGVAQPQPHNHTTHTDEHTNTGIAEAVFVVSGVRLAAATAEGRGTATRHICTRRHNRNPDTLTTKASLHSHQIPRHGCSCVWRAPHHLPPLQRPHQPLMTHHHPLGRQSRCRCLCRRHCRCCCSWRAACASWGLWGAHSSSAGTHMCFAPPSCCCFNWKLLRNICRRTAAQCRHTAQGSAVA